MRAVMWPITGYVSITLPYAAYLYRGIDLNGLCDALQRRLASDVHPDTVWGVFVGPEWSYSVQGVDPLDGFDRRDTIHRVLRQILDTNYATAGGIQGAFNELLAKELTI